MANILAFVAATVLAMMGPWYPALALRIADAFDADGCRLCNLLVPFRRSPGAAFAFDGPSNDTIATAEAIDPYTLSRGDLTESTDNDDYFAITVDEGVLEAWLLDYGSSTNTFALTLETATATLDSGVSGISTTGLFLDYTADGGGNLLLARQALGGRRRLPPSNPPAPAGPGHHGRGSRFRCRWRRHRALGY